MLKVRNCFVPWRVLLLAELRAGMCNLLLWYVFFFHAIHPHPLTIAGALRNLAYMSAMFFVQRRIASGLPLRFASLQAWRRSPDNFRRTSQFLRGLRTKTPLEAGGSVFSGQRPVAVLTGGERGIGFEVAQQLARESFDLFLCCPFPAEAERAIADIYRHAHAYHPNVHFVELNLAEEASVRACAAAILSATGRIDLLINNGGILSNSGPRRANARGDELVVAVNFLGPVLLTELLLPRITAGGAARIVNVASLMELNANVPPGHTPLSTLEEHCRPDSRFYTPNYSLSKLLLISYTRDLAVRLRGTPVAAVALHPGVVFTAIYDGWGVWAVAMRAVMRTVFRFPPEAAEVVLRCAIADDVRSGGFYADQRLHEGCVSPLAADPAQNRRITEFVRGHFGLSGPTGH